MDEKVCSTLDMTSTDATTLSMSASGVFIKANGGPPSSSMGTDCPSTSVASSSSTLKRGHHHHHHHHVSGTPTTNDSRRSISWHRFASHLGVCALVLAYALLGSIVFLALEGHESMPEVHPRAATSGGAILTNTRTNGSVSTILSSSSPSSANDWRQKTVESIWDITVSLNILYKDNWTRLAGQELTRFQHQLILRLERQAAATASSTSPTLSSTNENNAEWTLARAFLYSLTLLTTIGVPEGPWPRSALGKAATVCYAALGIPLMLLYLSTVGAVLGSCAKGVFSKALCCCLCSNCGYCCYDEVRMAEKERRERLKRQGLTPPQPAPPSPPGVSTGSLLAPLLLCLTALTIYIAFGAIILSALEPNRSLLDSAYICFLCVTTIGLPLGAGGAARPATLWFCSGYIVVGMALTATCCTIAHGQLLAGRPHGHGHINGTCVHRASLRGLRGPDS